MKKQRIIVLLGFVATVFVFASCTPKIIQKTASKSVPVNYNNRTDTANTRDIQWKDYFADKYLIALIDSALSNNQELNITLQEIEIARNEVRARKGEYLPMLNLGAGAGFDKVGAYTRPGVIESNHDIVSGKKFPEPLGDLNAGAYASWEIDIWKKLRNAKKGAYMRYLASVDGKNFLVTNLISDIAATYYELLALDNQLSLIRKNIDIQTNALRIVRMQKQAARVTELAVRRFEAQVLDTKSMEYLIRQQIIEKENQINFLVGRFPQAVERDSNAFNVLTPDSLSAGLPSELLENRPDVRQAEMELLASNLDIKVAKANFYPSLGIRAGIGFQAFNPSYLLKSPESLLYNLAGDLTAPLINRNAIKASYFSANARQIQAAYNYEQTILNAYTEVVNQLAKIENLNYSYDLKNQQVAVLNQSIRISTDLFRSARADYMEVLLTQRDALDSRFELIDIKMQQLNAMVSVYRALGGGWN